MSGPNLHRITFFFLFLLAGTSLHSQLLFEKVYAGPFDDACEVRMTNDGGIVFIGSNVFEPWLVRTNGTGDTLWTRLIRWADFCSLIETSDGGLLLTGTTRTPNRDFVMQKFNATGDSLWAHVYPDSSDVGQYTTLETSDGGFLMTGYVVLGGDRQMYAIRTDQGGNELWRKNYGTASNDFGAMPAITHDDGFLLATTTNAGGGSKILVERTDGQGAVQWTKIYTATKNIGGAVPTALADGGFLITGWIDTLGFNSYLIRTDSLGNTLWTNNYGGAGFESRTAAGTRELADGSLVFLTSTNLSFGPGTDRDLALYRLDPQGNVQHIHRLGQQGDEMSRYFVQAANGDFVVLGYSGSFAPNLQQIYLARLDTSGCSESFYQLNAGAFETICPGDTLWLDAGAGFASYQWNNGATTRLLPVTTADTFFARAVDGLGCIAHSSVVITELAVPMAFSYQAGTGLTVSFDGMPGDATTWTWDFGDGSTNGLEDPTHTFAAAGWYEVCFSGNIPGCGPQQVCDSIFVGTVAVAGALTAEIRVYPNPARDLVRVEGGVEMVLMDIRGKVLGNWTYEDAAMEIDVSHLSSGIYLYRVRDDVGNQKTGKLVLE